MAVPVACSFVLLSAFHGVTVPRCVQALTVEGHLGSFQIWANTNKATVNINVQTRPFLRYQIGQENRELHKDAEQSTEVKTPLPGLANLPKMTFDPPVSAGLCSHAPGIWVARGCV